MEQRADGIHPGVAMRDHHALRMCGGAAGVIDCEQIGLANFRARKFSRARLDHCFIVEPVLALSVQSDEVFNARKAGPNAVDRGKIIAVCANHARTAMIDQVNEVVGGQAIV